MITDSTGRKRRYENGREVPMGGGDEGGGGDKGNGSGKPAPAPTTRPGSPASSPDDADTAAKVSAASDHVVAQLKPEIAARPGIAHRIALAVAKVYPKVEYAARLLSKLSLEHQEDILDTIEDHEKITYSKTGAQGQAQHDPIFMHLGVPANVAFGIVSKVIAFAAHKAGVHFDDGADPVDVALEVLKAFRAATGREAEPLPSRDEVAGLLVQRKAKRMADAPPRPGRLAVPDVRQTGDYDCGPACMLAVLAVYGQHPPEADLIREMGTTPADGTDVSQMAGYAERHGLQVEMTEGADLDDLRRLTGRGWPCIVCIQFPTDDPAVQDANGDGHYVVVVGVEGGKVRYQDPWSGPGVLPADRFVGLWHDVDGDGRAQTRTVIAVGPPRGRESQAFGDGTHDFAGYDPAQHPRDDHGRFIDKGDLEAANAPAVADELRARGMGAAADAVEKRGHILARLASSPHPSEAGLRELLNGGQHAERFADTPHDEVALAGPDGLKAAKLLGTAKDAGTKVLHYLARRAVARMLAAPDPQAVRHLFDADEYTRLADQFAATNATANLLGRARVRERADQAEERARLGKSVHAYADAAFTPFANPPPPLPPQAAIDYFTALVPAIGVDPQRFGPLLRREAFTLAHQTDQTLLAKVKGVIADTLTTGDTTDRVAQIEKLLDAAGVGRNNAAYAENILRTNVMDAYVTGTQEELRTPEMQAAFPVWQYLGIEDGRQRPAHEVHFNRYYPNTASFGEVRDSVKGSFDGFQCRCVPNPVDKYLWADLQKQGATVETSW